MTFEKIKHYYEHGLWSKNMVALTMRKGIITPEQYEEIVGEPYNH